MTTVSSQVFSTLRGSMDPSQMCGDVSASVAADWYPSGTYSYNDSYMTPFPSSTVESQPWTQYTRAPAPAVFNPALHQLHVPSQGQQQFSNVKEQSRPRSSPSTFGPALDSINWTTTSGLGIQYSTTAAEPTPATSTFPPNVFQTYPIDDQYSASSPPEILQPQPRRSYTSIAPNPAGMAAIKRLRDDDEAAESSSSSSTKRRKRTSSVASADLSDDDRFLVQLKEDENLPWKDIAGRFFSDKGKTFQVAALQMRYKRLREKFRTWEQQDLDALKLAVEYWEKSKWEIISAKMTDYGISERWPARHCARRWQAQEMISMPYPATTGVTPSIPTSSQFPSPIEAPIHRMGFMPM